jgi:ATP-dependent DNA helicase RecQ
MPPNAPSSSCAATRPSSSSSSPAAIRRRKTSPTCTARCSEGGDGDAPWTLETLQGALDRPPAKLQVALRLLRHRGVARQDRDGRLALTREGLDADALDKLLLSYRDKREHDRAMLERMVFYGQTGHCRWKVLLENFDAAEGFTSCRTCDNCVRIAAAFEAAERETKAEAERADEAAAASNSAPPGEEAPLPQPGELVRVPRYGRGVVEAVSAEGVTVVFPEGTKRVFLPSFVRREGAQGRQRREPAKVTASAA